MMKDLDYVGIFQLYSLEYRFVPNVIRSICAKGKYTVPLRERRRNRSSTFESTMGDKVISSRSNAPVFQRNLNIGICFYVPIIVKRERSPTLGSSMRQKVLERIFLTTRKDAFAHIGVSSKVPLLVDIHFLAFR